MSWVKLDDRFHGNRKIRQAWKQCRASIGLYAMSLTHSAQHTLDGHIENTWVTDQLRGSTKVRAVRALVENGLWTPTEHGYLIHDFLEYNKSRAELALEREKGAKRKAAFRREKTNVPLDTKGASGPPDPTRPDPLKTSPPIPLKGGNETGSELPPERPKSQRRRNLQAFEAEMADWAQRHFPESDPEQVAAVVALLRMRHRRPTIEAICDYARAHPEYRVGVPDEGARDES